MGFTSKGYGHPRYCQSLSEFGTTCVLAESAAYYLRRAIPGTNLDDAIGAYPMFTCERWEKLEADLNRIGPDLVSFSAVLDPLGRYDPASLKEVFPDLVLPFKTHFLVEFDRPLTVSRHHLRNARKATAQVKVEVSSVPSQWLCDWVTLYDQLVQRHGIRDLRRFSHCAFSRQFEIPGMWALRAIHQSKPVGMLLFLAQNDNVYYHLGAHNAMGYRLNVSFALFAAAIDLFRAEGFARINLGAGAGMGNSLDDGLSRFKAGWANHSQMAYFCGRILNRDAYAEIVRQKKIEPTSYFPAYRQGEFCKKPINKE